MAGGAGRSRGRRHLHRASRRRRCCTTGTASSACAPAIAASTSTAAASPRSSPASTSTRRSTIFCDGVRGNLTKTLVSKLKLDEGRLPQLYALGIKELWEIPPDRLPVGHVIHTMGYPLRMEEFGGAFIYAMPDGLLSVGFVSGLDYRDPMFDPHLTFQRFKLHPFVSSLLEGGKMVRYGAKALPEGGLAHGSARAHGRRAHRRRRRRVHELDAAQGHSPRDAYGHARGRDGVRRRARGRRVGEARWRATRTRSTRARSSASCTRCGTSTRRSSTDSSRACCTQDSRLATRGWWIQRSDAVPCRIRAHGDARQTTTTSQPPLT